jgi:hypothetical protein
MRSVGLRAPREKKCASPANLPHAALAKVSLLSYRQQTEAQDKSYL